MPGSPPTAPTSAAHLARGWSTAQHQLRSFPSAADVSRQLTSSRTAPPVAARLIASVGLAGPPSAYAAELSEALADGHRWPSVVAESVFPSRFLTSVDPNSSPSPAPSVFPAAASTISSLPMPTSLLTDSTAVTPLELTLLGFHIAPPSNDSPAPTSYVRVPEKTKYALAEGVSPNLDFVTELCPKKAEPGAASAKARRPDRPGSSPRRVPRHPVNQLDPYATIALGRNASGPSLGGRHRRPNRRVIRKPRTTQPTDPAASSDLRNGSSSALHVEESVLPPLGQDFLLASAQATGQAEPSSEQALAKKNEEESVKGGEAGEPGQESRRNPEMNVAKDIRDQAFGPQEDQGVDQNIDILAGEQAVMGTDESGLPTKSGEAQVAVPQVHNEDSKAVEDVEEDQPQDFSNDNDGTEMPDIPEGAVLVDSQTNEVLRDDQTNEVLRNALGEPVKPLGFRKVPNMGRIISGIRSIGKSEEEKRLERRAPIDVDSAAPPPDTAYSRKERREKMIEKKREQAIAAREKQRAQAARLQEKKKRLMKRKRKAAAKRRGEVYISESEDDDADATEGLEDAEEQPPHERQSQVPPTPEVVEVPNDNGQPGHQAIKRQRFESPTSSHHRQDAHQRNGAGPPFHGDPRFEGNGRQQAWSNDHRAPPHNGYDERSTHSRQGRTPPNNYHGAQAYPPSPPPPGPPPPGRPPPSYHRDQYASSYQAPPYPPNAPYPSYPPFPANSPYPPYPGHYAGAGYPPSNQYPHNQAYGSTPPYGHHPYPGRGPPPHSHPYPEVRNRLPPDEFQSKRKQLHNAIHHCCSDLREEHSRAIDDFLDNQRGMFAPHEEQKDYLLERRSNEIIKLRIRRSDGMWDVVRTRTM